MNIGCEELEPQLRGSNKRTFGIALCSWFPGCIWGLGMDEGLKSRRMRRGKMGRTERGGEGRREGGREF